MIGKNGMNKKIGFLIVLLGVNLLLSFMLEPAKGASESMWKGYYEEESLDMIFVGSSLCQGTFDPYIIDEYLGVNSYNMGTPLQAVPQSVRAIEVALEEHDIKTVIYGVGFSTLKYEGMMEAELTFEKARIKQKGGMEGLLEGVQYLFSEEMRNDEKSINYLFPWLYNREELSLDNIIGNVKLKIRQQQIKYSGGTIEENSQFYKGYLNYPGVVFNYDNVWETNSDRYYGADLNTEMMEALEEMLILCNEKDVELIVVNTPHPFFDVVACYEFYEQNDKEVKSLCEEYGVDYYDFSLAKPEIFQVKSEYYSDYEHLNLEGAEAFSQQLCDFLSRRAEGEDMESYFYSVDEFLEIYDDWLKDWKEYSW